MLYAPIVFFSILKVANKIYSHEDSRCNNRNHQCSLREEVFLPFFKILLWMIQRCYFFISFRSVITRFLCYSFVYIKNHLSLSQNIISRRKKIKKFGVSIRLPYFPTVFVIPVLSYFVSAEILFFRLTFKWSLQWDIFSLHFFLL